LRRRRAAGRLLLLQLSRRNERATGLRLRPPRRPRCYATRSGRAMSDLLPPPTWPPAAPPADGRLGRAAIEPSTPVVAGAFGTWTITYTAGRFGIDDGGALRIAFHTTSDLGAPQFDDPPQADYCRVTCYTPAPTRLEARYDGELGVRPWKRVI